MITIGLAWTWSSWRCPIVRKLEQTIGLLSGSEFSIQKDDPIFDQREGI